MEVKKIGLDGVFAGFKKAVDADNEIIVELANRTVAGMLESGHFTLSDFGKMGYGVSGRLSGDNWTVEEILRIGNAKGDAYMYADAEEEDFEVFIELPLFERAFAEAIQGVVAVFCNYEKDSIGEKADLRAMEELRTVLGNRWMEPASDREVASVN